MSELDDMRGLPYTPSPIPQIWLGTEPPTPLLLRANRPTDFLEASAQPPLRILMEPPDEEGNADELLSLPADVGDGQRTIVFVRREGVGRFSAFPMQLGSVQSGDIVFANLSHREIIANIGSRLQRIPPGQRAVAPRLERGSELSVALTTSDQEIIYHGFLRAPRGGSLIFIVLENTSRTLETVRLSLSSEELSTPR